MGDSLVRGLVNDKDSPLQVIKRVLTGCDRDGLISRKRMSKLMDEDEVAAAALDMLGMNVGELDGLAKLLDAYDIGYVSVDELILAILQLKDTANPVFTMMYNNKQVAVRLRRLQQNMDQHFLNLSRRSIGALSSV